MEAFLHSPGSYIFLLLIKNVNWPIDNLKSDSSASFVASGFGIHYSRMTISYYRFILGDKAREMAKLSREERKQKTVESYARIFGTDEALEVFIQWIFRLLDWLGFSPQQRSYLTIFHSGNWIRREQLDGGAVFWWMLCQHIPTGRYDKIRRVRMANLKS